MQNIISRKQFIQFVGLLLLISVSQSQAKLPQEVDRLSDYREEALTNLQNIFFYNSNNLGDKLQEIHDNTYVKDAFSAKETGIGELECEKIFKKIDYDETNLKDKYFIAVIANKYCKSVQRNPNTDNLAEQFSQSLMENKIVKLYYAFMGLHVVSKNQQESQKVMAASCEKLHAFVAQDGTTSNEKRSDYQTYGYSAYLFEMYEICLDLAKDQQQVLKKLVQQIRVPLASTLLNMLEIEQSELTVLEADKSPLETNARILRSLMHFLSNKDYAPLFGKSLVSDFKNNYLMKMVRFLKSQEDGLLNSSERYHLIHLYKEFNDTFDYLFIRNIPVLGTKQTTEIQFRFENLMGQTIKKSSAELQNALSFEIVDRKGAKVVSANQIKVSENEKNEKWPLKMTVTLANLKQFGPHQINVESKKADFGFKFSETLHFVTKVTCEDLQFEVSEDKNTPAEFSNRLKENEKILMPMKVNGDKDILHLKFKLTFDRNKKITPRQVGVVLLHPTHGHTSTIVQATYDDRIDLYRVKLILNKSEHLLPYNNLYEMQLMVSDERLREQISWKFAKLQIKYKTPRQDPPPSDTLMAQDPEIRHSFRPPQQEPPLFFVCFFCVLIVLAFVLYLRFLSKLGMNSLNFPKTGLGNLLVKIFIVCIAISLLLLAYFWVAINLYQLFLIIISGIIPFFIIGRLALQHIPDTIEPPCKQEGETPKKKND